MFLNTKSCRILDAKTPFKHKNEIMYWKSPKILYGNDFEPDPNQPFIWRISRFHKSDEEPTKTSKLLFNGFPVFNTVYEIVEQEAWILLLYLI